MKNQILTLINKEIVPSQDCVFWRYAPEFAASQIEELFKQWHIAVVMQALPDETLSKEAVRYDEGFGLTYLSTKELQRRAFIDGASFALQAIRKAAVASEGQGEANMSAGFCECTEPKGDINQFGCMNCQKQIRG